MKGIKSILLGLSMIISFALVNAQAEEPTVQQKDSLKYAMDEFIQNLDLSDEQQAELREINQRYGQKLQELRSSDMDRSEKYGTMRALRTEKDEEVKALLTDEQYAKYTEGRKEVQQKARMRIRHKKHVQDNRQ